MNIDCIKWWLSLEAKERFALMKKHNVKSVNDKLIKRMWNEEYINNDKNR